MSRKKRPTIAQSAARGALAGLAGGVAMVTAERVVLPRLPDRRQSVPRWDSQIGRAADALGWELSPAARGAAGIATQLLYSAFLGAAYSVASNHLRTSRAGRQLIDSGLVFGISLLAPELPRKTKRQRMRGGMVARLRQRALDPVTPSKVFGQTTSLALRALSR